MLQKVRLSISLAIFLNAKEVPLILFEGPHEWRGDDVVYIYESDDE